MSLAQSLNLGLHYHQTGNFQQAEIVYRQILAVEPRHADAWHFLGLLAYQTGKANLAVDYIGKAIALAPAVASYHSNLGVVFQALGRFQDALNSYDLALRLNPQSAESFYNRGLVYFNLGKLEDAVASYRQALRFNPRYAEAHNNLGAALQKMGQLDEAAASCREALRLNPHFAEAHNNLGATLQKQGKFDEAVASCRQALRLKPNWLEASTNLASTLCEQGKLDEALAVNEQILRLQPDNPQAHSHRALIWFLAGKLDLAFAEYEWRWKLPNVIPPKYTRNLWDGSPLAGRTILLHAEQGFGDTFNFIRYAPLVKQKGGKVLFECPRPLVKLLGSCLGIDEIFARGERLTPGEPLTPTLSPEGRGSEKGTNSPAAFDVQAPLLSLPKMLGTTLDTIPALVPYIHADAELVAHWQRELSSLEGCKIGINWSGNLTNPAEKYRSVPLRFFENIARLPDVQLISLQKGSGVEQLQEVAGRFKVIDLGNRLDETAGAFMDTAAVMKNLDLVITSDTSIPHLAGALGVPVWVAIPFVPDWRWMLRREDSPWYPTMRLFRQRKLGSWEEVFQDMTAALEKLLARQQPKPGPRDEARKPILVEIAAGELIDKITILEIKSERIQDTAQLANVRRELTSLLAVRDQNLPQTPELAELTTQLRAVNQTLWQIEDDIRICEHYQEFGLRFIELARSVYMQNDQRTALKRRINEKVGAFFREEKCYAAY